MATTSRALGLLLAGAALCGAVRRARLPAILRWLRPSRHPAIEVHRKRGWHR